MSEKELAWANDELIFLLTEIDRVSSISSSLILSLKDLHREGALNLLHYLILHDKDVARLSRVLEKHGFVTISELMIDVAPVLLNVQHVIAEHLGLPQYSLSKDAFNSSIERRGLSNTTLFGSSNSKEKDIMVTLGLNQEISEHQIEALIMAGVTSVRLNFSHGTLQQGKNLIDKLRKTSKNLGAELMLVADVCGNKLRLYYASNFTGSKKVKLNNRLLIVLKGSEQVREPKGLVLESDSVLLFIKVKKGSLCYLDDGKVEGVIEEVGKNSFAVKVLHVNQKKAKLKDGKGFNIPSLNLVGKVYDLTKDDKAVKLLPLTDSVCLSFIRSKQELEVLVGQITRVVSKQEYGVIIKIENEQAYRRLPTILLEAMKYTNVAIMIARGDLSVECGWDNLGLIQQEIHKLCKAAYLPDIWATQVLDLFCKNGIPSRSEMSDVGLALNSSCIMLNKGKYIVEAVKLIREVANKRKPSFLFNLA